MTSLELKVPPPVVALVFGVLMWLLAPLIPGARVALAHRAIVIVGLVGIGSIFGFGAVGMFFRAGTTTNPIKPEKTSTLVTRGVLGLTRNPMYLSLVFYLVAWAVYLSNWATLLLVPAFMLYITRFQIVPEERFLSGRYGAEYIAYQARVRRWL